LFDLRLNVRYEITLTSVARLVAKMLERSDLSKSGAGSFFTGFGAYCCLTRFFFIFFRLIVASTMSGLLFLDLPLYFSCGC
jgi:hypothetical protein